MNVKMSFFYESQIHNFTNYNINLILLSTSKDNKIFFLSPKSIIKFGHLHFTVEILEST